MSAAPKRPQGALLAPLSSPSRQWAQDPPLTTWAPPLETRAAQSSPAREQEAGGARRPGLGGRHEADAEDGPDPGQGLGAAQRAQAQLLVRRGLAAAVPRSGEERGRGQGGDWGEGGVGEGAGAGVERGQVRKWNGVRCRGEGVKGVRGQGGEETRGRGRRGPPISRPAFAPAALWARSDVWGCQQSLGPSRIGERTEFSRTESGNTLVISTGGGRAKGTPGR